MSSLFRHRKDKSAGEDAARGFQRLGPEPDARNQAVPPQDNNSPQVKGARDLWAEAFASLSQEDQITLQPAGSDGKLGNTMSQRMEVEKVKDLTEIKYKEYCRRGWHTKKGDVSKETNVRIKAKEIMCSAMQFNSIVEAGLKFDPSGYGTIVWGVLSGVLKLVQNDKEKVDAVFDSAAVMARFLPRYAIIEAHYRDRPTLEQTAFENQIEHVYVAILSYAACVQKELNRSVAGRIFDSFWTLDNQNVKILKDDLENKDRIVTDQAQFVAHQYRQREFQELAAQASETLNNIDIVVEKLLKAERLSTLKWLSDSPIADKQQQLRSQVDKVNKNSGMWLLESSEYVNWLAEPHSFVWLHGTSGCGKSSLCSTVVKNLTESAEKSSNTIAAYWYFDNADGSTQNLQRLLRLILRRIAATAVPFPEAVRNLASKHELPGSMPSTIALMKTLKEAVADLEEDFFLVLDAVDEYHADNDTLREEFLDFLVEFANTQAPNMHLFVTSMPDIDIENAFKRLQKHPVEIDVEKPVSVDLEAYLDVTIKKHAENKRWSLEITNKIYSALKDDGRFRIVSLQLEDLRKCYDEDEINAALKSIPSNVEDAYLRKLKGVLPKDIRRLSRIFYWISVAVRRLTTLELAAAPGVSLSSPQELHSICPSGLIRLEVQQSSEANELDPVQRRTRKSSDKAMEIVTFDHPSVKRFLYSAKLRQSGDDHISKFFVSEQKVNAEFVNRMVDHLLAVKQPRIEPQLVVEDQFLQYIAQHWHQHLMDRANISEMDEALKGKLKALFGEPIHPAYLNWMRIWNPESKKQNVELVQESCPSPLYSAIFLGLEGVAKHLIATRSHMNNTGSSTRTLLQLASQRGYTAIIQELIVAGENVNETADDQPTALYNAVENGNAELVEMLLAAGANPNAKQDHSGSVLQLASSRGLIKIVESLIASGAGVNLQSGLYGTALQAAAAAGDEEVVNVLLKNGAKPDAAGGLLGTPIQAAATGGHSELVKLLAGSGVAWDEGTDSTWREAYDLWLSQSPRGRAEIRESFYSKEPLDGSDTQRMLAGVLKTFQSLPDIKKADTRNKSAAQRFDAKRARSLDLMVQLQKQGLERMESEHYVYRALFWAKLIRLMAIIREMRDLPATVQEALDRLSTLATLRAPDQTTIEHGTSDAWAASRYELVKFYVLLFQAVSELEALVLRSKTNKLLLMTMKAKMLDEIFERLTLQNERFESYMKIARVQEPPVNAALLEGIHHDLSDILQQDLHECFRTLEQSMQRRLEEVEQRVVASVQDILPSIIREEMRKALAEQRSSIGGDNRP